jgi:alkylation response protein AidB-like acyl-CoA dehydrogenase
MTTTEAILDRLEPIAAGVIAAAAAEVDAGGTFPEATIEGLRQAGLLSLMTPTEHGGLGASHGTAAAVIERIARECGSSAMVVCMHYCGAAVLAKLGSPAVNRAVAAGEHLSTLAFSEAGSRSHFWAPTSTAWADGERVVLDADKSWVTAARHADAYVWSSQPLSAQGASTIWLVPANTDGLSIPRAFDGLGLRGNDSTPVTARGVSIPAENRLGEDGEGFNVMMGIVLPLFNLLNAACSIGLMEGALGRACAHASGSRYAHMDAALADLPTIRAYLAKARVEADMARGLWQDAIAAVEGGRPDAMLRVLQVKAAANEAALSVTDTTMRVCGGAAFRRDVGVERYMRDARAGAVMAPTSDVLYDFIGKAICGMDLF